MQYNFKHHLVVDFNKEKLIDFINFNSNNFELALSIALKNEQPFAWRSAWLINHATVKNDQRIIKNTNRILKDIQKREDGHQRELLKLLQKIKVDENTEGIIFNECMTIWEDVDKIPSTRMIAFKMILSTVEKYPELMNEISFLMQEHYIETLTPGAKHSFLKMKKKFDNDK